MAKIDALLDIREPENDKEALTTLHRSTARGVFFAQPNEELRGRPQVQITSDGRPTNQNAVALPASLATDADAGPTIADRADVAMGETIRAGALPALWNGAGSIGTALRHIPERFSDPQEQQLCTALLAGSVSGITEDATRRETPGAAPYLEAARTYRDKKSGQTPAAISHLASAPIQDAGDAFARFTKLAHYALTHEPAEVAATNFGPFAPYVAKALDLRNAPSKDHGKYSPSRLLDRAETLTRQFAKEAGEIEQPEPQQPQPEEGEQEQPEGQGEEEGTGTNDHDKLGDDPQGTNEDSSPEDEGEEDTSEGEEGEEEQPEEEGEGGEQQPQEQEGEEGENEGEGERENPGEGEEGEEDTSGPEKPQNATEGKPDGKEGTSEADAEAAEAQAQAEADKALDALSEIGGAGDNGLSNDDPEQVMTAAITPKAEPISGIDELWRNFRFKSRASVNNDPLAYRNREVARADYSAIARKVAPLTAGIKDALTLLQPIRQTRHVGGHRTGDLDEGSLHRLYTGEHNPRVFTQPTATSRKKVALTILLDASGSMGKQFQDQFFGEYQTRATQAKYCTVALLEAVKDNPDIDVSVMAYDTSAGPVIEHLYGRRCNTGDLPETLTTYAPGSSNYDAHAVQYAETFIGEEYDPRQYDHRLFIMLHDGLACHYLPMAKAETGLYQGSYVPDPNGREQATGGGINDPKYKRATLAIINGTLRRMIGDGIAPMVFGVFDAYDQAYADQLAPDKRARPVKNAREAVNAVVNALRRIAES